MGSLRQRPEQHANFQEAPDSKPFIFVAFSRTHALIPGLRQRSLDAFLAGAVPLIEIPLRSIVLRALRASRKVPGTIGDSRFKT